jgi:AhpD family alkylhydroperoxidase
MEQRINYMEKGAGAVKAMYGLELYLAKCSLDKQLLHLVKYRVSQINGCAFCLDMHSKDLRAGGETEQRLYCLDAWRETPFYTSKERAALAWAEAVTLITVGHVSDAVYEEARKEFSEEELIDLTTAVAAINAWNRVAISFRAIPGTYQPATHAATK